MSWWAIGKAISRIDNCKGMPETPYRQAYDFSSATFPTDKKRADGIAIRRFSI
jgi:hypothetical protein